MKPADTNLTLLEAARIVARGGALDEKLDALCGHVVDVAGAEAAVIYLLDPVRNLLVPAAAAGLDQNALAEHGQIALDDPSELAAQVVRERRVMNADRSGSARAFTGQRLSWKSLAGLPLLAAADAGADDAEGVILAAFKGSAPDLASPENALPALADLCAVAIRQARLENALQERADWIGRLASTDALTGIANRVTFERMLELEIARATRQEAQLSLLLIDIDGFAEINDRGGAQVGDEVLRHAAATLADQVRLVDTVARIGPDEFAVIAPGGGGEIAGRRVRDALAGREAAGEPISISVGAVVYPIDGASSGELLEAAARALAEAKRRGRGSIFAASGG